MKKPPETPPETTIDTHSEQAIEAAAEALRAKMAKAPLNAEMKADPVSRKLVFLSFLFAVLAISCIGFLTFTYYHKKRALRPVVIETTEEKPETIIIQTIDEIQTKLKNDQDIHMQIATECSQKETCTFIKEHQAQVRDLINPIITNVEPDQLSNLEYKKNLRKKLTDRINKLEMPGKVIQIHINNLSIEGHPLNEHHE